MYSEIYTAALSAGLTPLVARIALLLADIDGADRAYSFIEDCRLEDELRASLLARRELVRSRQRLLAGGPAVSGKCRRDENALQFPA